MFHTNLSYVMFMIVNWSESLIPFPSSSIVSHVSCHSLSMFFVVDLFAFSPWLPSNLDHYSPIFGICIPEHGLTRRTSFRSRGSMNSGPWTGWRTNWVSTVKGSLKPETRRHGEIVFMAPHWHGLCSLPWVVPLASLLDVSILSRRGSLVFALAIVHWTGISVGSSAVGVKVKLVICGSLGPRSSSQTTFYTWEYPCYLP